MGYFGRRIGKSPNTGNPTADGTGGGILDLFTNGYFQRQGNIYNVPPLFFATGGTVTAEGISPGNGYRYHVFTAPGTFTVESGSKTIEYLVVAGGGAGGTGTGGGGGAGGVRNGSLVASTPLSVTVGAGAPTANHGVAASNGNPSALGPISATGGGRGASGSLGGVVNTASPGGSGGGGMIYPSALSPTPGSGNAGGYSPVEGYAGGTTSAPGGGGGGGAGGIGGSNPPGVGGPGAPFPAFAAPLIQPEIPAPAWPTFGPAVGPTGRYAGGGGGTLDSAPLNYGYPGGSGGGGNGGNNAATPGVNFTGSGGGANWGYSGAYTNGGGGSGIVIVRYLV